MVGLLVLAGLVIVAVRSQDDPHPAKTEAVPPAQAGAPAPASPPASDPLPTEAPTSSGAPLIDYSAVESEPDGYDAALVIGNHLQAVTDGRYQDAYDTYSARWRDDNPYDGWQSTEATTQESNASMISVQPRSDGTVAATVAFQSTQSPGYGPKNRTNETCTQWRVVYRLVADGSNPSYRLAIDGSYPGTTSVPCA